MFLANAFRSLRGRRTQRRPNLLKPHSGRKYQRLSIELLEQRLPPGDAVMGGLLTQGLLPERAAEFIPAARAAAPVPAQRLAEPSDFTLLLGETGAIMEAPFTTAERLADTAAKRTDDEPFTRTAARPRDVPISDPSNLGESGGLSIPVAAPQPLTPPAPFLAAPPLVSYVLDQAASAVAPAGDSDHVLPADLQNGASVRSAGVRALFNLGHPTTGPFPSNWFTVPDKTHLTDQRVNLPYPDCTVYVSDCQDLAVLNELDGFNLQPRLSVPFTGPIDVKTVNSTNIFLVSLGSTTKDEGFMPRGYGVGINQIVWDVATNALHVESDELLAQHTRFALFVTTGVRDAQGDPVRASPTFTRFLHRGQGAYHDWLLDAMAMAKAYGFAEGDIAAASVFTTQSATAVLEKIRDQIKAQTPEPADFLLGPKGERTVFNRNEIAGIRWDQQTRDNPPGFTTVNIDLSFLDIYPDSVGQLGYGKYRSPNYLTADGRDIPAVGTRTGTPAVQSWDELYFTLALPSGTRPPGGWPIAIFGHGSSTNKNDFSMRFAASNAVQGLATIFINKVGNGFGPLGTLTVSRTAGEPVMLPDGGRGLDVNGDGVIGVGEGGNARPPRQIINVRDGYRQTAADLMQLVRVIGSGIDVDGDGTTDVDPTRVYYYAQSAGGWYGTAFLAVEPDVRAGVLNVTGGTDTSGRSPGIRPGFGTVLANRVPPLVNGPGIDQLEGVAVDAPHFHDNMPLRDGIALSFRLTDGSNQVIQSPVINAVAGAMAIQDVQENRQWVSLSGDPQAYAPYLRRASLPGVPAKSVIIQFAKGDQGVPNPMSTAMLRAGQLADRASYYRHDLAYAENPLLPKNPHGYITPITDTREQARAVARGTQAQIAAFFASDGKTIIHPEPARFFEVPLQGPLPEELNYIP